MGLGKTLEMIALIVADNRTSGNNTTLIVAPMGVMSNWTGQVCVCSYLIDKNSLLIKICVCRLLITSILTQLCVYLLITGSGRNK